MDVHELQGRINGAFSQDEESSFGSVDNLELVRDCRSRIFTTVSSGESFYAGSTVSATSLDMEDYSNATDTPSGTGASSLVASPVKDVKLKPKNTMVTHSSLV